MSKGKDDAPHELESQFVLRLPPVRARSLIPWRPHRVTPSPARPAGQHRLPEGLTRQRGSCGAGKGCGSRLGALRPG